MPRPRLRYRAAPPKPFRRGPHQFERDWETPDDEKLGWSYCRWCHLPGRIGDERHPLDAPSLLPLAPDEARQRDAAILGEREPQPV